MISRAAALAAAILSAAPATAAITIFTDRAAFLSAVADPGVDTFDDLSADRIAAPLTRTAGRFGYTADLASPRGFLPVAVVPGDIVLSPFLAIDTMILRDFAPGVTGVGGSFFVTDVAGAPLGAAVTLVATDADGPVTRVIAPAGPGGFFGVVSPTLVSLRLVADNDNPPPIVNYPAIDDLVLGSAAPGVPEPAEWLLLIAGFGLIGTAMRQRGVTT